MSILYVAGNYITATTLSSVSSEDSTYYGKENMYNKIQSLPWGMTAKAAQYAIWDLGTDRPSIIALLNHNLTSGVTLTLSADNDPPNWLAPTWGPTALTYHKLNIFYIIPAAARIYRWWRLDIADAANPNLPRIGEIILYTYSSFTKNYWWPYIEGTKYEIGENITDYGLRHRRRKAQKKTFKLDWNGVTDTRFYSEIETFFDALNGDTPFVFAPDSTDDECWYMYCLNDFEGRRNFYNINAFSLLLEEQSRGITLL